MTWLHQQRWEKAKASLIDAANKGIDIAAVFGKDYQGVKGFEKITGLELPRDIAAMLKQQEEQIHIPPIEKGLSEFQAGMESYLFEDLAVMLAQPTLQDPTPSIPMHLLQSSSPTPTSLFVS